jgi:hypothetical protein
MRTNERTLVAVDDAVRRAVSVGAMTRGRSPGDRGHPKDANEWLLHAARTALTLKLLKAKTGTPAI